MADTQVDVKFGGDAGEARKAIADVQQALRDGLGSMNDSLKTIAGGFSGLQGELSSLRTGLSGVQGELKQTSSHASALGSGFASLGGIIKTALAGIGVSYLVKETIDLADAYTRADSRLKLFVESQEAQKQISHELYELSQETRSSYLSNLDLYSRLAQALKGTNTSQRELVNLTETLNKAFAISGSSTESRTAATIQLSQALASGALRGDEFNSVMENGGRLVQILTDYTGKNVGQLREMAEQGELTAGVVRNALAAGASKVNEEFSAMQVTFAEAGTTLKNTIGGLVSDANKGSGATKGLADEIVSLSRTIDANRDAILSIFKTITAEVKEAIQAVGNLANSIRGFAAVSRGELGLADFAQMGPAALKQWFDAQAAGVGNLQSRLNEVRGQLSALSPEKNGITDEYRELVEEARMLERAISSAKEVAKGGNALAAPDGVKTPPKADETGAGKIKKAKTGGGDTRLQEWKTELEQMHETEQDFFKSSLTEDAQYWQSKLANVQGNGKHEQTLRRQIEHELYQIHKQQAMQARQLDEEDITAKKNAASNEVEIKRQALQTELDLGEINNQQKLLGDQQLAGEQLRIDRAALDEKLQMYRDDAVAVSKLNEQKAELMRKYQLTLHKTNADILKDQKQSIDQMLSPITNAISTSVQGIIQGTTTMTKALHNLWQSMFASFADMLAKGAKDWVVNELAKTAITKQQSVLRTVLEKAGLVEKAAATAATNTTVAASTVATEAAVVPAQANMAASGAAAAVAPTPWVGPALAAAAFASIMAMIMGSRGHAVGSWDVPADMFTKIHKGEMIVPEQFAQNVRDGGGLGGGGSVVHLHVNAVDAGSVRKLFRNNGAAMAEALRRQARNFTPLKV